MSSLANSTTSNARPRIAVIGGGISGLAATLRLEELLPGATIDLFESSPRLGGVLHTLERDGYLVEQSADNFLIKPPAAIDLCRNLGLGSNLLSTDDSRRRAFVVRNGQLVPIPQGFYLMSPRKLLPLLVSPALSVFGKLRLLLEPFVPRRFMYVPGGAQADQPAIDESVASFARRRLGREVFERFVQPLVAGIYTADPERLSMAATMPQFLAYEQKFGSLLSATLFRRATNPSTVDPSETLVNHSAELASGARYGLFVAPERGLTHLVNTIAGRLARTNVRLNAPIKCLSETGSRWQLKLSSPDPAQPNAHDGVVIALPAKAAAGVLSSCDRRLSEELDSIEYASCAVISLGFRRDQIAHKLDGFGFVVPQSENRRIIAASFASLKFSHRAPPSRVLIRVFLGGALQPDLLKNSDDELVSIAVEELSQLLAIAGKPEMVDAARWPQSMPQYLVGHLARVERIEQAISRHTALALAGNAYRGVGIPQCIASGNAAAERVAASLG